MNRIRGTVVWKFEDHFNADRIIGSSKIGEKNIDVLGQACMAELDPNFANRVRPGDIMIAGRNFGYGHPHQQSIQALKKVGISTVIAESFYPAWYRMAFFHKFPVLISPAITQNVDIGDQLEVDFALGNIVKIGSSKTIRAEPIPSFLLEVLQAGGLVPYLRKQLAQQLP